MIRRQSHNQKIFRNLMRKGRRKSVPVNVKYFMLYSFLYKYLSDKLKRYLTDAIGGEGDDIKYFYMNSHDQEEIRSWALNDLGYFIDSYPAYIDQFVSDKYADDIFTMEFFTVLKNHIIFSKDSPQEGYFMQILEILDRQTKLYRLSYDEGMNLLMSNYLYLISRLDVFESDFTFTQVFDNIASSRQIRLLPTPEYITNILGEIINSKKPDAKSAYDPFLRDSSILFNVLNEDSSAELYGKEDDDLYYFYSLIKAFINDMDFEKLFLFKENAIESMSVDSKLFDVIASKIPNRFREYSPSMLKRQSLEAPKQSKTNDIKDALLANYDMDKLSQNTELIEAIKVIEEQIDKIEKSDIPHFSGEYESLNDSEFLFLINMINSLKDDGIMAVSVSQNFLFKNSLSTLRKFLTHENGYIDAIISLPEELGRSVRPEVIIVFRKNKNIDDVLFIDLSKKYNAVPSRNAVSGLVRRNLLLDDSTMNEIRDVYLNRRNIEKFSQVVSLKDIEANDFNLTVSRYVDTYEGDFIRLEDLVSTKMNLDAKNEELTQKISSLLEDLDFKLQK